MSYHIGEQLPVANKITNDKHQITNKSQITKFNDQNIGMIV